MQGEIITIGNELTSGRVLDLNAYYAAGRLTASGLKITRVTTVGDDAVRVARAVSEALEDSQFVIITGGLGSTEDDLTNEAVAEALHRPLCLDREKLEQIRRYIESRGMRMTSSLEKMAWVPKDARALTCTEDMCGFSILEGKARLYFLPGVPEQMRFLLDNCVLPEILHSCESLPLLGYRVLKVFGLSEPAIAETLKGLSRQGEELILGFYPRFPENHITISLKGFDETAMTRELDRMEAEIRSRLGACVFGSGTETLAVVVGDLLRRRGLTLSTAESCTGGLIGNLVTDVPGSSTYFLGGVVVYGNQAKMDLLQVPRETLNGHGAVSDPTVRQMAEGLRMVMKADLGLAVTGIAGPDGGSPEKPVGTVHIGLAAGSETLSGKYAFRGRREQVKLKTAMMALDWVRRFLHGDPFLPGL
ncbi:MAG: CinA family nicotinamide mononucleotide deamidase-related protein [Deltaproteobacteria bacterium]|nr:CinA family nicotinamide mononucleotide deamidase-related protein [Deltaproteobacteria bacterium]